MNCLISVYNNIFNYKTFLWYEIFFNEIIT